MRARPIVAIDGPSGVGKSTVARLVASYLCFSYIDTGALYRTVALIGDRMGIGWDDGEKLAKALGDHRVSIGRDGGIALDGSPLRDAIRTARMSAGASRVARHGEVREALLAWLRALGKDGGVVLEGRDIGTVVFPDAEHKFFLTAAQEKRARRRFEEMLARGEEVSLEEVLDEQRQRDHADSTREVAPLRRAKDALEIETDDMTAEAVARKLVEVVESSFPLTSK